MLHVCIGTRFLRRMQEIVLLIAGFTFGTCVILVGIASFFVILYYGFNFLKRRHNPTSEDPEVRDKTSADFPQENAVDEATRKANLRLQAEKLENMAQAALVNAFGHTKKKALPDYVLDSSYRNEPEDVYIDDNEGLIMNVIAAVDEDMCIGKNGVLPWNVPSEYKYFLSMITTPPPGSRNAVIVGRKTWQTMDQLTSIPLPNALNIVLSKGNVPAAAHYLNTVVAHSLPDAVNIIKRENDIAEVWVIGGAQIYTLAMQSPYFHRLYLTYIHAKFGCDTYFPFMKQELEYGSAFRRLSREEIDNPRVPVEIQTDPTSGLQFEIRVYGRRNPDYNEY